MNEKNDLKDYHDWKNGLFVSYQPLSDTFGIIIFLELPKVKNTQKNIGLI
jgi:hypothetical protein